MGNKVDLLMADLAAKTCIPCNADTPILGSEQVATYLKKIPKWRTDRRYKKISRKLKFKDFVEAMVFVESVAKVAEENGHHPDINISYNTVTLILWTHRIGGLSENDFILAAKIDRLI